MFDNSRVIRYHYRNTRAYAADVYDQDEEIGRYLTLKEQLLAIAEPIE